MYYNPEYVCMHLKEKKNACTRAFLHMILHCIFSHPFQYEKLDRECWDLATDLAVEQVDSGSESEMCGAGAGCVPETDVIAFGAESTDSDRRENLPLAV